MRGLTFCAYKRLGRCLLLFVREKKCLGWNSLNARKLEKGMCSLFYDLFENFSLKGCIQGISTKESFLKNKGQRSKISCTLERTPVKKIHVLTTSTHFRVNRPFLIQKFLFSRSKFLAKIRNFNFSNFYFESVIK